jgi:hypothetical protein
MLLGTTRASLSRSSGVNASCCRWTMARCARLPALSLGCLALRAPLKDRW